MADEYINPDDILVDADPEYSICGEGDQINILLLALSTFPFDKESKTHNITETRFTYQGEEYLGRYQLDPVPKILSSILSRKGERLDYIICFCTAKRDDAGNLLLPEVQNQDKKYPILVPVKGQPEKGAVILSELEYFKRQISMYMPRDDKERVLPVIIDESSPAGGIEEAVSRIRLLEKAEDGSMKAVHLYLDSHGGFRDVQLTLQAVISLLGKEEISVENSFSVKFGKDYNTVTFDSSMEMFDFASGINEFINYGQLTSLDRYLRSQNLYSIPDIDALMTILRKISESISICDTIRFEEGLTDLTKFLEGTFDTSNLQILSIFIGTIKKDFGVLLTSERTAVDEIKWCLRKEYYQQALTLIESKMPGEFVRNGLRYYCDYNNRAQALEVFNSFNTLVNTFDRWKLKDPAHFFIRYYHKMTASGTRFTLIKDKIMSQHSYDPNYMLENKSRYAEADRDDIDRLINSYFSLCEQRNMINHGINQSIRVSDLQNSMQSFISEYENILARPHDITGIMEFIFVSNSAGFELPPGDEWKQVSIPDTCCIQSDTELEFLKKMIYTFREKAYPDNRCGFQTALADARKLCSGGVPKRTDLGDRSPFQVLIQISSGIFTRTDNDLIWNP